ncbi:SDR family oxidoreductase [Actinoplanes sp. TBRC 11911]|uniref:SDR family oxidoreductase n=1 Tax=Actinoplanes sp. TBRC 11911 TaxID=2729386 RepID=UPI00145F2200|nr:SDR family oxidoreductase [Actinoplanes sp. TBRC 11911]NMO50909.1 SDR family oxidoreductase [Actinoplanes sp. TBRC 11911]
MDLTNAIAVVTGANRGLGRQLTIQLLERGANVYAGARRPESVDIPGAVPLLIDLNDPATLEAAARIAGDATLLINNAGVATQQPLIGGDLDSLRLEMETNYFGTLAVSRAFVPVLKANGGGTILNINSAIAWVHFASDGGYAASKAAGWALTNAMREELAPDGIDVTALHVAFIDTDFSAHIPAEQKISPVIIAQRALDGLAAGQQEILADDLTRQIKAGLSA